MIYSDFTITITERGDTGYPVFALTQGIGRVNAILPHPDTSLKTLLTQVAELPPHVDGQAGLRSAGAALFRWLFSGPLEAHWRVAWDRASQLGRGLRLRLSIDAPEIGAWPWELLHDPLRDHAFGVAITTPLVRYLDQASRFGGLAEQEAELPLEMLLVLPKAPNLDLRLERALIEEALAPLEGALKVRVLEDIVTRTGLGDALLAAPYDIIHFAGHGGFEGGQGYIVLNRPDGSPDWVDDSTLARFVTNYRSLKLVVSNTCSSGRVDDALAFRGMTPQLLRSGVPAVIAMQYPLTDQMGAMFAREFYRQLCLGEHAGQVDVAVTHARNMLAILYPGNRAFAAPVLYTHAPDSVIFSLPQEPAVQAVLDPSSQRARLAMFIGSLQTSADFEEDWALAGADDLVAWRHVLKQAETAYRSHLESPRGDLQKAAQPGLTLVEGRLAALEQALARVNAQRGAGSPCLS